MDQRPYILILYTTRYRTGGARFEQAATTMEAEKRSQFPEHVVIREPVESKRDFLEQIARVAAANGVITEFHFIGHSGMYGIMFGTTQWPEQFSPYEWTQISIPFARDSRFYFHACRSGRWFAPFVARTLGVTTYGYFWYTTFSTSGRRFRWPGPSSNGRTKLYVVSCPGKKSHGVFGSLYKYGMRPKVSSMLEFVPTSEPVDRSYDSVAKLYDQTFEDIAVRHDEWTWLASNLGDLRGQRILDIGCGNGALLKKLSDRHSNTFEGCGVDASSGMIEQAKRRCSGYSNLSFTKIDGPRLPFSDSSFDRIVSLLSFRYLDWDPILAEILRVLKPGGELLVVDMVAAPVGFRLIPRFVKSKISEVLQRLREPAFFQSLRRMVTDPRWQQMLAYNPIRAEHELKWYLESRFAGRRVQFINVGWKSRILAFRSGPVHIKAVAPLTFP